jgi:hypothetical protein
VRTDLHITGKVAQFGRGIIGDVSKKLMEQFAANLNTMLDEQPANGDGAKPPSAAADEALTGTDGPADAPSAPKVRKIEGPATEPVDLAGVAGPAILKRVAPLVVVLLLVFFLLRRRR